MATVRISQLTAITAPTDDDVLIINDADTNTRKITFANLTQNLLNTTATAQTKTGALTVGGTLTASNNFIVDTNTFFVDSVSNKVGVRTTAPAAEFDVEGSIRVRNSGEVQFGDGNNSNYVGIKSPAIVPADYSLTLPTALPSATSFLTSTSTGQLGYSSGITISSGVLGVSQINLDDRGSVRFYESAANGSEYVAFQAPTGLSFSTTYELPPTFPSTTGHVLSCSTTGVLSWVSNAAGAAGGDNQVQFSTSGVLNASSNFTFQPSTNLLTVTNATVTGALIVEGSATLGNGTDDLVALNGRIASSIVPSTNSTYDLGTSGLRFEETFLENLDANGNVSLGTIVSDLIPTPNVYDLGSALAPWQQTHSLSFHTGSHAVESGTSQNGVASAASFNVTLGASAGFTSFKALIQATDDVTGDIEFYEYFIVHDGAGAVSEVTGSNVQAPTSGTFLTTPAASIVGPNVVLAITNSAASGNAVSIRVLTTAIAT